MTWLTRAYVNTPLPILLVVVAALVLVVWALASGAGRKLASLAIMTAFKAGRDLVGQGLTGVSDADLAQIARSTYAAWPGVLMVGPLPLPVGLLKSVISEAAWVALVEKEYRAFAGYYRQVMSTKPGSLGGLEVVNTVAAVKADAVTKAALTPRPPLPSALGEGEQMIAGAAASTPVGAGKGG